MQAHGSAGLFMDLISRNNDKGAFISDNINHFLTDLL